MKTIISFILRNALKTIIILLFLTITSCGTYNVNMRSNSTFTIDSPITVVDRTSSAFEIKETFESLLLDKGFNLISESVAKTSNNIDNRVRGENNVNYDQSIKQYNTIVVKSNFIIEIKYRAYSTISTVLRSFSANVVDLNSGSIVLSASFSGDRPAYEVLPKIVSQIEYEVNKN